VGGAARATGEARWMRLAAPLVVAKRRTALTSSLSDQRTYSTSAVAASRSGPRKERRPTHERVQRSHFDVQIYYCKFGLWASATPLRVTILSRAKLEVTMPEQSNSPFLTVREAADYLRLKKRTLDNMRWMGTGPLFRKHGGRVYYDVKELTEWSLSSCCKSTSPY
jgi:Helix-turn-helix domain